MFARLFAFETFKGWRTSRRAAPLQLFKYNGWMYHTYDSDNRRALSLGRVYLLSRDAVHLAGGNQEAPRPLS